MASAGCDAGSWGFRAGGTATAPAIFSVPSAVRGCGARPAGLSPGAASAETVGSSLARSTSFAERLLPVPGLLFSCSGVGWSA